MPVDESTFKTALSHWGSGVTVITTRDADGAPVGLTATSFASLSLQPQLVLFCLGRDSTSFEAFQAADAFAVHVLAAEQDAISNRFASRGGEKFAGLAVTEGLHGLPLLPGCVALLQCRVRERLPGGDHLIMVGEVEDAAVSDAEPLVYFRGGYRRLAP